MVTRFCTLTLLSCVAMGCDTGFRPETLIAGLRVLGVRSTPADLKPGERSRLEALVLDPSRGNAKTSTLWVGCAPDPFNLNRSSCSDPSVLQDPTALGDAMQLPPGVSIIGFDDRASYAAPQGLFDVLAADDPRRFTGTVGQALAISVAEDVPPTATPEQLRDVFRRIQDKSLPSLITLARIPISENPERNSNPVLTALTVDERALALGEHVMLHTDLSAKLDVTVPDETFEPYTATVPDGQEARTERIIAAWYSSAGRFTEERTTVREEVITRFTAPGVTDKTDPVPSNREGFIAVVLRDTRGGTTWGTFPLFVCELGAPSVTVSRTNRPTQSTDTLELEGLAMDQIVDVIADGAAISGFALDATHWQSSKPVAIAQNTSLTITTRGCERFEVK